MRYLVGLATLLAAVVSAFTFANEQTCGTGDNAPCAPVLPMCAGAFCDDSVYTSPDPDPSARTTTPPGEGELARQVWATRELPMGADGGSCGGGDNYSSVAWVPINNFEHVGANMGAPFFGCPGFGCPPDPSIHGLPPGTYQAEYCVVINNDGSDDIKQIRTVAQVVKSSGTVDYVGRTYTLGLEEGNQQLCDTAIVNIAQDDRFQVGYYRGGTRDGHPTRCRGAAAAMSGAPEVYDYVKLYQISAASP